MIIPLSRLPFWVLYRLSDLVFHVLYHLVRYRRRVVFENLKNAFPEKSRAELEKIARKFYAHLCDLLAESIKGSSVSESEIGKRHRYTNIELLDSYYPQGRPVTIVGAHYGNWEWVALSLPLVTKFQTYGIFLPLSNSFMNRVIKVSRERNGMKLISTKEVGAVMRGAQTSRITMGYIGDQSPARTGRHYWLKFLNQDTAVIPGYEVLAKECDSPVIYLNIVKTKRGFYEGTFFPIADAPRETKDGEIIEAYMGKLEKIIKEKPEHWLWSHRRWKLKVPCQSHGQVSGRFTPRRSLESIKAP